MLERCWRAVRASIRLGLLVPHLVLGISIAGMLRLASGDGWVSRPLGRTALRYWARGAARIIGLRVTATGNRPAGCVFLVANHISWLDVLGIQTLLPVRFVAKSEVRAWPLIGSLAGLAGTLFLHRERVAALGRTVAQLGALVECGQSVCFFPEGTTSQGEAVTRFHPALFQSAIDTGAVVQPLALRYGTHTRDTSAAFVGNDRFFMHLLRTLGKESVHLRLSFGVPVLGRTTGSRRALADSTRDTINELLAQT